MRVFEPIATQVPAPAAMKAARKAQIGTMGLTCWLRLPSCHTPITPAITARAATR